MNSAIGIIVIVVAAVLPAVVGQMFRKRASDRWARANVLYREGIELARHRRFPEAQAALARAVGDMSIALPPNRPEHLPYFHALAEVHCMQGHYIEARQLCRRALNRHTLALDVELHLLETLGAACYALGTPSDLEEAEVAVRRALTRAGEQPGADLASYLDRLGSIHVRRGDYAAAEQELSRAVDLRRAEPSPSYWLARALQRLGTLREVQGRRTEARNLHQEALAVVTGFLATDGPSMGQSPYRSSTPEEDAWTSLKNELVEHIALVDHAGGADGQAMSDGSGRGPGVTVQSQA